MRFERWRVRWFSFLLGFGRGVGVTVVVESWAFVVCLAKKVYIGCVFRV
jgi:hypothetical protein